MPDLNAELKKLQDDLAKQSAAADAANAATKSTKAKIDVLQRQLTEQDRLAQAIKTKQDAYNKEKIGEGIATGVKSTRGALEAVDPGKADKIDAAIKDLDEGLAKAQKDADDLAVKASEAAAKVKPAEDKLASSKKAFEDSFKVADGIGKNVEQAKALKAKMGQADSDGDLVAAYVYAHEAKVVADSISFPDAAKLADTISKLRTDWDAAGSDLDGLKKASADATTKAAAAAKDVSGKRTDRLKLIVEAARKA